MFNLLPPTKDNILGPNCWVLEAKQVRPRIIHLGASFRSSHSYPLHVPASVPSVSEYVFPLRNTLRVRKNPNNIIVLPHRGSFFVWGFLFWNVNSKLYDNNLHFLYLLRSPQNTRMWHRSSEAWFPCGENPGFPSFSIVAMNCKAFLPLQWQLWLFLFKLPDLENTPYFSIRF